MRKTLSALAALGMAILLAAVAAGCGGTSTAGHTSAASHGSVVTPREKAVKFAECMRTNGVGAFPDPDASGALTIDAVANGSSLDTSSAAFTRALGACKDLEPAGFTGHQRSPEEQKAALEFAQCIRDNGVKDFPDPGKGDPLVDTNRIPSAAARGGMTILHAAMHKCGGYASAAGVQGSK